MTTEPITRATTASCQIVAPVAPSITQTDPEVPVSVPSTTSNCPLPSTSANAGLDDVCPSRVPDHTRPRRVVKAFRVSVSLARGQYEPVPTTIPVAPPAKNPPTAGDESTSWLVS